MREFRYDTAGKWYKGNTHIHSVVSDGGKDFKELAELYASEGYSFLFRTDHRIASDSVNDREIYPLLWLDGLELEGNDGSGSDLHMVCLGSVTDISGKTQDFESDLITVRRQGAFTILAHPHWRGNLSYDYAKLRIDGIEVYNHNGRISGLTHWNDALKHNPGVLAFAADDAHLDNIHTRWNGGWIVVNAAELSGEEIMAAIRRGNFYSSCGPTIYSIEAEGESLHIETSPVKFFKLLGPDVHIEVHKGNSSGKLLTDICAPVPIDWPFVYLEIEDIHGRKAWTNNLFL